MLEKICIKYAEVRGEILLNEQQKKCYDCGGVNPDCKDYEPASKIIDRVRGFYKKHISIKGLPTDDN